MQHALSLLKTLLNTLNSIRARAELCCKQPTRFASLALLAALLGFNTSAAQAAGNHLDYTFSSDGKVTTAYGRDQNEATAVVIQPDGKIVVVGETEVGGGGANFAIFRYNTDGSLDTSFSSDGRQWTDFGSYEYAKAVALQADGKIVVVGHYDQNGIYARCAVARYNTNGTLDTTFSDDGLLLFGFPSSNEGLAEAVAIQPDGKILVAGKDRYNATIGKFAIARLNSSGSFDTTFSSDGKVTTYVGSGNNRIYGVVVQPDGKIIAAGQGDPAHTSKSDFVLVRYNPNGSIDGSFENNGIVSTDFGGTYDSPKGIKRTLDGKFVLAGGSELQNNRQTAIARYNSDGTLDTTFDGDGKVLTDLPYVDGANDLAVTSYGKIVVACTAYNGVPNSPTLFTLLGYRSDGQLDDTFGTGGRVFTLFGTLPGTANGLAIQSDGRIVAVGVGRIGPGLFNAGDFAVARYNRQGIAARADFDEDGRADFAVFRPSEGSWYILKSTTGTFEYVPWYLSTIQVPGDYDGDGKTDVASYHPASPPGWWYVRRSSNQTLLMTMAGTTGDIPVQGDYDGDSITDWAIFRPSTGYWYLYQSTLGNYIYANFGQPGDKLVQADYDGDGLTDVALFRPSTGTWSVKRSTLGFLTTQFGTSGDIPVPADYDGDGRADVAVFRPSNGTWYITNSLDNSVSTVQLGAATDIPAPADFDADGKTDLTVFRPSEGNWYVLQSTDNNPLVAQWGQNGDVPISGSYTPQ